MKFSDYAFSAEIHSGIEKAKFVECTPVQEKTFNFILEGRDVYAQSQTGTGKTAAFLISTFHLLQLDKYKGRKALVVVPTRELAVQIKEEADVLGQNLDFKTECFYGGTGYKTQEALLEKGVDIVVATPGRLLDFSKQGKINFKDFSILIIDEADRLFDMGFIDDIRRIFNGIKNVPNKMTLLFSATMNPNVGNISWEYMNNPGEIFIEAEHLTVESIEQELYHVGKDEKMSILLGLLKRENPESAIIFTNTKHMAHEVSKRLEHNGYSNSYLMGDLPQKKRLQIVNNVKDGKIKFLVATDVAARGLHVDDLSLVINFDLPVDTENYVHRIGRTARAGKEGKAITLACESYSIKIDMETVTVIELVVEKRAEMETVTAIETVVEMSRNGNHNGNRNRNRNNSVNSKNNLSEKDRLTKLRSNVMNVSGANSLDADFSKDIKKHPSRKNSVNKASSNTKNHKNSGTSGVNRNRNNKNKQNRKIDSNVAMKGVARVTSDSKIEDRLAYYKKKYGEDFKPSTSMKE
ncbi:MAG: hypothetical protein B6229_01235 [Spirochaetaceae bacterium 4572_7]|nr:MAG: hypothetical protein B6229_01235 [Spirochaetaceae bacterium 4572_7]